MVATRVILHKSSKVNIRIFTLKELNLNGKDIQNCDIPKEKIKEVLKDCLKYVFYHPDKNDKETLMLYIRDVWK